MIGKKPKKKKKNGDTEVIHGRKVSLGKGLGKKTGRRASSAIEARRLKMQELGIYE
jgi:hypothetical protein